MAQLDRKVNQRQLIVNQSADLHSVAERIIPNLREVQLRSVGQQSRLNTAIKRRRCTFIRIINNSSTLRVQFLLLDRLLIHNRRYRTGQYQSRFTCRHNTESQIRLILDILVVNPHHILRGHSLILRQLLQRPVRSATKDIIQSHILGFVQIRNKVVVESGLLHGLVTFEIFRINTLLLKTCQCLLITLIDIIQINSREGSRNQADQSGNLHLAVHHIDIRNQFTLLYQHLINR